MNRRRTNLLGLQTVAAAWLAVFCLFGYRATFAVFLGPLQQDMGWTAAQTSLGYSLMMVVYAVTAFLSGFIIDRWGTRPCYAIGAVFGALGFLLTSLVTGYAQYLVTYAVFAGIGTGMLWVTAQVSVRRWYVGDQYATRWGLAFMGAPMAQVLLSLWVSDVLRTLDWRIAMRGLAGVIFVALAAATFLAKGDPQRYDCRPHGSEAVDASGTDSEWTVSSAYRTFAIWGGIAAFLLAVTAEFLIWTQVTQFWVVEHGFSLPAATNFYVAIGVAGVLMMPLMGVVADRVVSLWARETVGRRLMLILAPMAGVVACLVLMAMGGTPAFSIAACVLFAIYWSIEPGGVVGYVGSVYGRSGLGQIWGLATLIVMGIGPALGSFMGGYLFDLTGSYNHSMLFALGAFALSGFAAFLLPLSTGRGGKSDDE